MDAASVSGLLTPEGWALLESLPPYVERDALRLGEQLRAQGHPAELVAAALTQSRLRAAGIKKFGEFAAGMLFTQPGLEQATRLSVAAHHARRFAATGVSTIADLGCGIGADSMAMAGLGAEVTAVEKDELTAAVATVNLRHFVGTHVLCDDITTMDLPKTQAYFFDPARRTRRGQRKLDPRDGSPPLDFVVAAAARVRAAGMKTAPGLDHELIPDGAETQWVSVDGDLVEACIWFSDAAREGIRTSALVLDGEDATEVLPSDGPEFSSLAVGPVAKYLYEPDPAVMRSGLVGAVAAACDGHLIDDTIAYVSSDALALTPLARAYAVEDVFAFSLKAIKGWLRERDIGTVTLKKRGTAVDLDVLHKQLKPNGSGAITLILTRVAGQQSVIATNLVRG